MSSRYWFATLLCLFTFSLSAQDINATVYGIVTDASGASIPAANVTAVNPNTGLSLSAQADEAGSFTIRPLPAGTYTITVESDGFKSLRRAEVPLAAGQRVRLEFSLELGQVTQAIDVTDAIPMLNTVNAEQRSNIESRQIRELPVARRDWSALLALENGVNNADGRIAMNGLPGAGFRLTVDGTDAAMDSEAPSLSMSGGFNLIKGVSTEAIEQVNVAKGIASAEVGQTLSGNVNITTKRGTNDVHGSLFMLNQTENLNARAQFLSNKPGMVFNQFGGSLGGAIIKNKLFYFGVYEGYRLRGFTSLVGNVPTVEFKQRAIAAVPAYKAALDLFPDPNTAVAPGATNATYVGSASDRSDDNHAVMRVDYHATERLVLSARYTRGRPYRLTPRLANNPRTFQGLNEIGSFNATYAAGRWTSESRFGVNHNQVERGDYLQMAGISGITGGLGWSLTGEVLNRRGTNWSIEETLGTTIGKHSLKFGGVFIRPTGGRVNVEAPALNYANVNDFLSNTPTSVQITFGVRDYNVLTFNTGMFLQDDWRLNRRLTVSMGLRWDYFSVPSERDNRLINRNEPLGFGSFRPADSPWNAKYNSFSPRLGLSWDVSGKGSTVVRAGAGTFQNPRPLFGSSVDIVQNAPDEPFRVTYARADVLRYGDLLRYPVEPVAVLPIAKGVDAPISGTAINPNWGNPYSYQWLLTVQQMLPGGIVAESGYVGTRGVSLMMARTLNQPDRETGIRPMDGYLQFRYRDGSERSNYHGWQSNLRKQFSSALLLQTNYTFSRQMSFTNAADLLLPAAPQDPFNYRADYGPTDSDIKHNLATSFVFEPQLTKWFNATGSKSRLALDGWQVSGVLTARTGMPLTVMQPSGLTDSRPDYVGGSATLDNYTDTLSYLNPAAFARVPLSPVSGLPIRPGSVGRASVRAPGAWNLDLAVAKSVLFTERWRLQFRADLMNSLNHTNLSGVVTRIDAANFGRFTSTAGARSVQLSVRLSF